MNEELIKNVDICYYQAEQNAAEYFKLLSEQVKEKSYVPILINDLKAWKLKHIKRSTLISFFSRRKARPHSKDYYNYINWLDYMGKLTPYLDRSISYIFMRDLGKALDSFDTQTSINDVVDSLRKYLIQSISKNQSDQTENIDITKLYRKAQKEGIESTFIWLVDKLKTVSENIPNEMDKEQAQRKLIKIIAGVLMHEIEEMGADLSPKQRASNLDKAIRLGYAYGLTYPFIDDLLDAKVLSAKEEKQYSDLIRTTLITGTVPELEKWHGKNEKLIIYIHSELKEGFEYIKAHQRPDTIKTFFEHAYIFFNAQEVDRIKDLSYTAYSNEAIYIPIILKSSFSRLIVRSVISAPQDNGFDHRTFYYGIYNQLADDFADMFDDMNEGSVTPYTYYMKYHSTRSDLINPFELYWIVISHLVHNVYHSDPKTCDVILSRAINGLRRFKERMGEEKYNEVMLLFTFGNPALSHLIQYMVQKAEDVDFFDKLLRDHVITLLKKERTEQSLFLDTVEKIRNKINNNLHFTSIEDMALANDHLIDGANYCLEDGGKRLRPIITWVMAVNEYGLKESQILPLVKSLEYMHTASLIFDDLPSQDNALMRRGKPTLHQVHTTAIAELTGLFLTQKAIEEQTYLASFDPQTVLELIRYAVQATSSMCRGQAMDLNTKGKRLTLEELNRMCFYKTGLAFEVSLVMPAILAGVETSQIERLKQIAYHAGIAFQIKDDLLDVGGDALLLGKATGKDAENNNSTFVSVLGSEGAQKAMWEHYCLATETLQQIPLKTAFIKHLLDYIVNRNH